MYYQVDSNMGAKMQHPGRSQKRCDVDRVFCDLEEPGKIDPAQVADDDVDGDQYGKRDNGQPCNHTAGRKEAVITAGDHITRSSV